MKTIYVVAAIIRDGNKIFTTQRGYGTYKDYWEFPGGKVELDESPEEALIREIREELDTEIRVGNYITTIEYDYPEFHLSMRCYWATVLHGDLVLKEHEAAKWLEKKDIGSMNWLPADRILIGIINKDLEADSIGSYHL